MSFYMPQGLHRAVQQKADSVATVFGADGLIAFCHDRLTGYKCPRRVELREALPLSGAGKILKIKLREPFRAGRERQVG